MTDHNDHDHEGDGVDRRGFLKCMAWAGTGLVWTVSGGVLSSRAFGQGAGRTADGRLHVRPDQRQPHRLRQGPEQGRDRHAPGGGRQDQRAAATARLPDPHRRPHPPRRSPRSSTPSPRSSRGSRSARIFYVPGEHDVFTDDGQAVPEALRQGDQGRRAGTASTTRASISSAWSTSRATALKAGGLGRPRQRATRLAQERPGGARQQHADRGVRPRPALDGLPAVGLGHRGRPAGAGATSSGSARSPCSTATSTRSSRRSKGTSPSTPPARPPSPSRRPARRPARARSRTSPPRSCAAMLGLTSVNYVAGRRLARRHRLHARIGPHSSRGPAAVPAGPLSHKRRRPASEMRRVDRTRRSGGDSTWIREGLRRAPPRHWAHPHLPRGDRDSSGPGCDPPTESARGASVRPAARQQPGLGRLHHRGLAVHPGRAPEMDRTAVRAGHDLRLP